MKILKTIRSAAVAVGWMAGSVFAGVVAPQHDYLWIDNAASPQFELQVDIAEEYGSFFSDLIDSGSDLASVKVTGLPAGLKFDAKTLKLSGAPTKSGTFWTTIAAKNKNGFQHSRMFPFAVSDDDCDSCTPEAITPEYIELEMPMELISGGYFQAVVYAWENEVTGALPTSVKASGLPAGLQYKEVWYAFWDDDYGGYLAESYRVISGIPTKPGRYKATFTVTYDDRKTAKQDVYLLVKDGGSRYVNVTSDESSGTATKSGVYAMGANVSLSAKPANGHVFAGWHDDYENWLELAKGVDYRTASATYQLQSMDYGMSDVRPESFVQEIHADFVPTAEDEIGIYRSSWVDEYDDYGQWIDGYEEYNELDGYTWSLPFGEWEYLDIAVNSGSLPKLSVKGLPKGVKLVFDEGDYWFEADENVAPGRYTVTVSAQNQSKHSAVATFAIEVRAESEYIEVDEDLGEYIPGEPIEPIDLSGAFDFEYNKSFTVSGLPKGLVWNAKADAKKGIEANTITGTPTVPGEYLVVFSAKISYVYEDASGKEKAYTRTEYRTSKITVLPYPELSVEIVNDSDEEEAGGKIVGAGNYPSGTKVTLKAQPNPGYVFAGWEGDGIEGESLAAKSPVYTLVTGPEDAYLAAYFVKIKDDYLWIDECESIYLYTADTVSDIGEEDEIATLVMTRSLPTISVSGLPVGVKWDAKTFKLSGKPTKAGVYYATVTGKNASGYTHSRIVRFVVDDAEEPEEANEAGIDFEADNDFQYMLSTGNYDIGWDLEIPESPTTGSKPVNATVKGLPTGLTYDFYEGGTRTYTDWDDEAGDYVEYEYDYPAGIEVYQNSYVTKPGRYTLTFEVAYADKTKAKAVHTVTVRDSGSRYVEVLLDDDSSAEMGTVAGSGVYSYAQPLSKIVAKAGKGYVFAGWYSIREYEDGYWDDEQQWISYGSDSYVDLFNAWDSKFNTIDYRTASLSKAIVDNDLINEDEALGVYATLYASFVPAAEDAASIGIYAYDWWSEGSWELSNGDKMTWDVSEGLESDVPYCVLHLDVASFSLPKMTAKGLPAGFKFADSSRIVLDDRSKLKPGVYPVTITASNLSKATVTATVNIAVPNLSCEALPNLETATDAYVISVGTSAATVDLHLGEGYEDYTVTASGLPSGLKLAQTTSLCDPEPYYTLSGTPTKPGTYTVTFTAAKGKDKQVATITLTVNALPDWVVGTFYGKAKVHSYGPDGEWEWPNAFEVTISAAGVVSAKIIDVDGASITPNVSELVRLDDENFGFVYQEDDAYGEFNIRREQISDNICIGVLSAYEEGVDPEDDEFICEWSGYQNLYGLKTGLVLPTFKSPNNKLYIPIDDDGGLTLTFGANGAVSVTATTETGNAISGIKGVAAHMTPYIVDGNAVTARLYVMVYDAVEDEGIGCELDLYIPVSANGSVKASEIEYEIIDFIDSSIDL